MMTVVKYIENTLNWRARSSLFGPMSTSAEVEALGFFDQMVAY